MLLQGTVGHDFDIFAAGGESTAWVLLWKTPFKTNRRDGLSCSPIQLFFSNAFGPREWTMVVFWKEDSGRQLRPITPENGGGDESSTPSPPRFTFFDDLDVSHQRTSSACGWIYARGNRLINHAPMKESYHRVTLAQNFWDTDQVLFARGLLPREWLLASEPAECSEVRMWESSGFKVCARDNDLIASGSSKGSRETPKSVRQVAFGVATFSLQPQSDTSVQLLRTGFLGGQVPSRQTVPRAQVWGAIQIPSRVDEKSNIQIPIGARYVTRGITGTCGQSCSS